MASVLDPALLGLLVCPEDKGPLWFVSEHDTLYNERLRRVYEVRNSNIPVMLIDDARTTDDAEHQTLMDIIDGGGAVKTGPADAA